MFQDIDLRELAELKGPERAFVTVYLAGEGDERRIPDRAAPLREMLSDDADELEHFERNLEAIGSWLEEQSHLLEGAEAPEAIAIFSCWALDFLRVHELSAAVEPGVWVGATPHIRPLAELQEEYENFVVVTADNSEAHVYLVTSAVARELTQVRGDIKNHVKKGGWSQKRYQRRREDELLHYAKEIADVLVELDGAADFERLVLLGHDEAIHKIEEVLPEGLRDRLVGADNIDTNGGEEAAIDRAFELFFAQERRDERDLWELIKGQFLGNGLAVVGAADVLEATLAGRVDKILVVRNRELEGVQCRACESLSAGTLDRCSACGSDDVFAVDLVNRLVDQAELTSATVDFVDALDGLQKVGGVAALLRY